VTAPLPVLAWLDGLEKTHDAATLGRWCDLDPRPDAISNIDSQTSADGYRVYTRVGEVVRPADAAAIVAEHNATPHLVAALWAVLALHKPFTGQGGEYCDYDGFVWPCREYRDLTAALPASAVAAATEGVRE
jgi:hypothetical protein